MWVIGRPETVFVSVTGFPPTLVMEEAMNALNNDNLLTGINGIARLDSEDREEDGVVERRASEYL